jgi:hypothetical protein
MFGNKMQSRIPQLIIPLFPYLSGPDDKPVLSKRIRPDDALNIREMLKHLAPSNLKTFDIYGHSWSMVSVMSPYSIDTHIMFIETSEDRYVPGPDWVDDDEGDALMKHVRDVMDFLQDRNKNGTVQIGYNWSPRSWGDEEEKTGMQSIPSKWHLSMWNWEAFPEPGISSPHLEWIDSKDINHDLKRILGENRYAKPIGQLIQQRIMFQMSDESLWSELFSEADWSVNSHCLTLTFSRSMKDILSIEKLFSRILKPVAVMLDLLFCQLTEILTSMQCRKIDKLLKQIEKGPLQPDQLAEIRATPEFKTEDLIKSRWQENRLPEELLDALWTPVQSRCAGTGNPKDWWRKGFGYALVFAGPLHGGGGTLKIQPSVFVGAGGVVETQGVLIMRPEDKMLSEQKIRRKSQILWALKDHLKRIEM